VNFIQFFPLLFFAVEQADTQFEELFFSAMLQVTPVHLFVEELLFGFNFGLELWVVFKFHSFYLLLLFLLYYYYTILIGICQALSLTFFKDYHKNLNHHQSCRTTNYNFHFVISLLILSHIGMTSLVNFYRKSLEKTK
jgi:hypothetical protein